MNTVANRTAKVEIWSREGLVGRPFLRQLLPVTVFANVPFSRIVFLPLLGFWRICAAPLK
jgi:hypothetical protein